MLTVLLAPLWIPGLVLESIGKRWAIWRLIRGDDASAWRRITALWSRAGAVHGPSGPDGQWKIEFHVLEPFMRRHPDAVHFIRESLLARDPYVAAYSARLLCGGIRMKGGTPASTDLPNELIGRRETILVILGCDCEEVTLGDFVLRQCWAMRSDKTASSK